MPKWSVALLLLVPFILVPCLGQWLADREAQGLADGLRLAHEGLQSSEARQRMRDRDAVAVWRAQLAGLLEETPGVSEAPLEADKSSRHSRRAGQGIFVSARRVLELAQAGARPSGIPVPASGARPAGLMLVGVNGLGVGLRDGDILIQALGRPAVSEGTVVSAVVAARGARQPQLSGEIWRDGRSFPLVVAQPYVEMNPDPVRD